MDPQENSLSPPGEHRDRSSAPRDRSGRSGGAESSVPPYSKEDLFSAIDDMEADPSLRLRRTRVEASQTFEPLKLPESPSLDQKPVLDDIIGFLQWYKKRDLITGAQLIRSVQQAARLRGLYAEEYERER